MTTKELLRLHDETAATTRRTMECKNSDYNGGSQATDALANFKSATALGLHPVTGLLLRIQDKLMRIRSFVADGELRVSGESVEDACNDIVNYAILCKALLLEESNGAVWPENPTDESEPRFCQCEETQGYFSRTEPMGYYCGKCGYTVDIIYKPKP
jgi:hypothetical protein